MYDGYYEEMGMKAELVVLNMHDLTGGELIKIYDIVRKDAEGEENKHAAKRMNEYLKTVRDL